MYKLWDNLATCSLLESMTPEGWIIVDVRDISDVESSIDKIRKKIEIVSNLLCLGYRVCIRCVGGINRSNAIAIGVMCYMVPKGGDVDETWDWHFSKLKAAVSRAHITHEIERTIKKFLKTCDGRYASNHKVIV